MEDGAAAPSPGSGRRTIRSLMATGPRKALLDDEAIAILEGMARNEDLKATQRLRALEQLEKWRRTSDRPAEEPGDEEAPDPMADLDNVVPLKRKRGA